MTLTCEYADFVAAGQLLGASSRTSRSPPRCSNPFLQDLEGRHQADLRHQGRPDHPGRHRPGAGRGDRRPALRRLLQVRARGQARTSTSSACSTPAPRPRGYKVDDIMAGKYGPPGVALMLFRTYPRIPFYEQVHDRLAVLHRHGPHALLLRRSPRPSSTARTSSCIAKAPRRRRTCPT